MSRPVLAIALAALLAALTALPASLALPAAGAPCVHVTAREAKGDPPEGEARTYQVGARVDGDCIEASEEELPDLYLLGLHPDFNHAGVAFCINLYVVAQPLVHPVIGQDCDGVPP